MIQAVKTDLSVKNCWLMTSSDSWLREKRKHQNPQATERRSDGTTVQERRGYELEWPILLSPVAWKSGLMYPLPC